MSEKPASSKSLFAANDRSEELSRAEVNKLASPLISDDSVGVNYAEEDEDETVPEPESEIFVTIKTAGGTVKQTKLTNKMSASLVRNSTTRKWKTAANVAVKHKDVKRFHKVVKRQK